MAEFLIWFANTVLLIVLGRHFLARNQISAFAVCVILFILLHVRPVFFFLGLDTPYPYQHFDKDPSQLMTIANLTISTWISIFVVSYFAWGSPATVLGRFLPQAPAAPNPTAVDVLATVVTIGGAVATVALVASAGSVANFVYAVKIEKELAGYYLYQYISVLGALLCIFAILCRAEAVSSVGGRIQRKIQPQHLVLWGSLLLLNLSLNYLWGNRYNISIVMFVAVSSWHMYVRRISLQRLLVVVLVFGAILQLLKYVRLGFISEVIDLELAAQSNFWLDLSTSLHLSQYDAFMLAIRDAGRLFDFRDGKDFFNGLVSWVPRNIYPEKETFHIGGWFRRVYEPEKINGWPISVIGNWYVNFGALGVVAGAMISGIVASVFDKAFRCGNLYPWHALAGPVAGFFFLEGGVSMGIFQVIALVGIPLALAALLLTLVGPRVANVGFLDGPSSSNIRQISQSANFASLK